LRARVVHRADAVEQANAPLHHPLAVLPPEGPIALETIVTGKMGLRSSRVAQKLSLAAQPVNDRFGPLAFNLFPKAMVSAGRRDRPDYHTGAIGGGPSSVATQRVARAGIWFMFRRSS